jgi:ADP-glucose pyrophosphorylase
MISMWTGKEHRCESLLLKCPEIVCAQAYLFDDYWEDIGTIKSFFDANLALTAQVIAPYNGFMNFLLFW